MTMTTIENPVVRQWGVWMYAKSLSQRTVQERLSTVTRMAKWCHVEAQAASVEQVVCWLAEGGNWSLNTRWTYYTSLSAWFIWLQKLGIRADNPMVMIDRPRRPKGEPHPVSDRDMCRILTVRAHRRTRAMIMLAAFAGLRVHEIAKLKGNHLDLIERTITVTGKGAITATLPLHSRIIEVAYQMPRQGFWFPGADEGHQRRESVSGTIKEAMVRAGVPGSAHSLRHWFGTALTEAGVDVRVVQTLLRHQNLATTEIYTRVSERRRIEGLERLDPFRMDQVSRAA